MRHSSGKLKYDILALQNSIKRDPSSYYDEFLGQYQYYQSLKTLFIMKPQNYDGKLASIVTFLSQVSSCYKSDLESFPVEVMSILKQNYTVLDPSMRMCFVKALILMRNRGIIDAVELIILFFTLLRSKDKILRKYLQVHIINDIKNMNIKQKNVKTNTVLQNLMFKMITDQNATAAKICLDVMIELYNKHIWRDVKTVNAIATACFSKVNKIMVAACQFFLGVDDEKSDCSDSEDNSSVPSVKDIMTANKVNKKTRHRSKILKKTKQVLKKSKKKNSKDVIDFSAVHLLHDPQGMAEKLLIQLNGMNERYEIKMLVMNLISRLVGVHELILLNFYSLLVRYIKPHQRDVTKILMFTAQAAHEHVPPDVLEPVVQAIADNFITERNSAEVMTVGINAIREICMRCPFAVNEDLLHDLAQYKKYKNKNVMMSARSLIQLFRNLNPQMLKRKFRSRPTEASEEKNPLQFGALIAKSYIPGAEVLPLEISNSENNDETLLEEEDESDDNWCDVSSDEEDEDDEKEFSDIDDSNEYKESNEKETVPKKCRDEDESTNLKSEKEKAMLISHSRILSQDEFKKLKAAQIAKEVHFSKGKKRKTSKLEISVSSKGKEIVSLKDIEKLHKRIKSDKETRLSTVLAGREDREKFGKKKTSNSGNTKKQQKRNKAFMMIKHKVRSKQKRSFKDKQISLQNALLKRKQNR